MIPETAFDLYNLPLPCTVILSSARAEQVVPLAPRHHEHKKVTEATVSAHDEVRKVVNRLIVLVRQESKQAFDEKLSRLGGREEW